MSNDDDVGIFGGGKAAVVGGSGSGSLSAGGVLPSSRLVVKNLPKNMTELRLRRHFDSWGGGGGVTDVRLMRWEGSGEFRGFGYVGFRTAEEAAAAKEHFHRSFIGAAKVDVEVWVPKDLRDRPQSKRVRREQKDKQKGVVKKVEDVAGGGKVRKNLEAEILGRAREDGDFAEFLQVHRVGGDTKKNNNKWGNDDAAAAATTVAAGAAAGSKDDVEFDDDDDDDDDEGESDEDDVGGGVLKTSEANKKKSPSYFTLKLLELPRSARKAEVRGLFSEFPSLASVRLPRNARGFGFVGFKDEGEGRRAAKAKDKSVLRGSVVRVKVYKNSSSTKIGEGDKDKYNNGGGGGGEVVESVGESGRIYVRNLGYDVTEEELRGVFQKFGPLVEVHIPVDGVSGRNKGFGFVGFVMTGDAERAVRELDGRGVVQGRVLHLLPAREKPQQQQEDGGGDKTSSSYKKGKLAGMKKGEATAAAAKQKGWNPLFVNMLAVSELVSRKYGVGREELLLHHHDNQDGAGVESAGVRLALGEAEVVAGVEKFLVEQGVCLAAFDGEEVVKRSDRILLVRNLPPDATEGEVRGVFEKFGRLGKVVVPEWGVCAVVEFMGASEARKGFRGVAYSKFVRGGGVLFLEWAPVGVFDRGGSGGGGSGGGSGSGKKQEERLVETAEEVKKKQEVGVWSLPRVGGGPPLEEPEGGTTVFVKNLSFSTTEEKLKEVFGELGLVSGVKLAVKDVGDGRGLLSQGYGFVQFWRRADAERAVGVFGGKKMVDNHVIEVKESKKTLFTKPGAAAPDVGDSGGGEGQKTTLLVKNVPFQADKEEVAQLFRVFGDLKGQVRMPVKVLGEAGHRGFAFVEFLKEQHAKAALTSLGRSCHLYGRRLVLGWADESGGATGSGSGGGNNKNLSEELERRRRRAAAAASSESAGTTTSSVKRGMSRYFESTNNQKKQKTRDSDDDE